MRDTIGISEELRISAEMGVEDLDGAELDAATLQRIAPITDHDLHVDPLS